MGIRRVWTGNEACAEAAIAVGMRFFAGYPITPASEIAEVLARRLPEVGGSFIQMEDEIASIAAVIGASMAGAKAMTATSGPGFSLMQENLGFAAMAEVPCVVVDVQRVGPSSGVATHPAQGDVMQARWGTHGDHPVVALAPWSARETYDLTVKAFNISEALRVPVVILSDAIVGHMSEDMEIPESLEIVHRPRPEVPPEEYQPYRAGQDGVPPMATFGDGYTWYTTGIVHDETGFPCTGDPPTIDRAIRRLNSKVTQEVAIYEEHWLEDAEAVIVAYGSVARWALAAAKGLRAEGYRVGLFRPVVLWPFPARQLARALGRASLAVVPEMNLGQVLGEVERATPKHLRVVGLNRVDSRMLSAREIAGVVKEACSS